MVILGTVELLARTKYHELSLVMQLFMEALEQWNVVEVVTKNRAKDWLALSMIARMKKLVEEA